MPTAELEVSHPGDDQESTIRTEGSEEKAPSDSPKSDEVPDGGARAWLVATGGFAVIFCGLGFTNSFGTLQEYYLSHQFPEQSPDSVAWVGSIAAFLQFAAGMIGGPLFDRFGAWVIRPATIVYVFAMMMLSLCNQYWQVMLVQGILMGITLGFLQFPTFGAVSQHFEKKRAAALGVVVSGSSVGGIVIPIALSKMLNGSNLGFGWSIRVIGFLMIPLMGFACSTIKSRLSPKETPFWFPAAYKQPKFILLIISLFFIFAGMFAPLFFLPTYAVSRGMNPSLADYLLAITNTASTFGRIIPGILADKLGRLNIFSLGALATGIIIFCMNTAVSNAGLIIYSIFFGFASEAIISGASAAISLCPRDPREIGTYMGMGMSISAFGVLIGPPVNGMLVGRYGGFFEVSMFSGAVCFFGGCVALTAKIVTPQGILGRA